MFNEDIEAWISLSQQQNHLKMLIEIRDKVTLTPDYKLYLDKVILQDTHEYLDNYGGELKEYNV